MKHAIVYFMLFMCLNANSMAEDLYSQHGDMELRINQKIFRDAIQRLSRTEYRGEYVHGGDIPICSSPWIHIQLTELGLSTSTTVNTNNSQTSITYTPIITIKAAAEQCVPNGIAVNCRGQAKLGDLFSPIPIEAKCNIFAVLLGIPIFKSEDIEFGKPVSPLLSINKRQVIKLSDTKEIKSQFGKFVNGAWIADKNTHKREINLNSKAYGARGKSIRRTSNHTLWMDSDLLIGEFNVGERFYLKMHDRQSLENKYLNKDNFEDDIFLQLIIRPSLFTKMSDKGGKSGIFGELLPIRIYGNDGGVDFDIVLDDAHVKFGKLKGEDIIQIAFKVKSTSTSAYIKESEAILTYSMPIVENGDLVLSLRAAELHLDAQHFGVNLCLTSNLFGNIETKLLSLGTPSSTVDISLPDCIEVGGDKIKPNRRCKNGQRNRVLSRHVNYDNTKIDIKLNKLRSSVNDKGNIMISIPAETTIYQH